jgi:hypothetical protein
LKPLPDIRAQNPEPSRKTIHARCHREQALELLRRGWPGGGAPRFDADAALVLCRMRGFAPGLLFLYERMRLPREVLRVSRVSDGLKIGLLKSLSTKGSRDAGGRQLRACSPHLHAPHKAPVHILSRRHSCYKPLFQLCMRGWRQVACAHHMSSSGPGNIHLLQLPVTPTPERDRERGTRMT